MLMCRRLLLDRRAHDGRSARVGGRDEGHADGSHEDGSFKGSQASGCRLRLPSFTCPVYRACCWQYIRFAPIAKSFKGAYLYNDIKKQSLLHFHVSTVLESGAVTWAILQVRGS